MKSKTETQAQQRDRAAEILKRLQDAYPDAGCELQHWQTPMELAVATILSAQCTDKRVNMVTPVLFKKYHSAADFAAWVVAAKKKFAGDEHAPRLSYASAYGPVH